MNRVRGEFAGADETPALKPRDFALSGLLAVLFVGARLRRLDASCLWFDEIFSVHAAGHSWRGLLDFVALDLIHPPLFYLLLKIWIGVVGVESVWWLRLFPVLWATATIAPFLLLCRELSLRPAVRHLALLLMAVNGYLIQYAREVRMYSMLLFFATCSLWLFARFANSTSLPRRHVFRALALFAVNLLLVYTHYFGWLLVGVELLFLLIWRRQKLKPVAATLGALCVCYVPWLLLVLGAAGEGQGLPQNLGWASRPRALEIFQPFLLLHEPFRFRRNTHEPPVLRLNALLALLLFAPPLIALGWRALRRRTPEDAVATADDAKHGDGRNANQPGELSFTTVWLIFFASAPVVITFLLSQILPQSIWGVRHLIIVAPAYLLLAAVALVSLRPPWLVITFGLLFGCWLTLAGTIALMRRDDAPPIWCAWETLALQASRAGTSPPNNATEGDVNIYAFEDLAAYHLWYALERSSARQPKFRIAVVKDFPGLVEDKAYFLPRGFPEVTTTRTNEPPPTGETHFWVAFRDASSGNNPLEHPYLKMLSAHGYEIGRQFSVAASGQQAFLVSVKRR